MRIAIISAMSSEIEAVIDILDKIEKKKVELPSAIKEFGSYDASVRLYAGVVAPFKLKVEEL